MVLIMWVFLVRGWVVCVGKVFNCGYGCVFGYGVLWRNAIDAVTIVFVESSKTLIMWVFVVRRWVGVEDFKLWPFVMGNCGQMQLIQPQLWLWITRNLLDVIVESWLWTDF